MQVPVTCENLGRLDKGLAEGVIDAALRQAFQDADDRGEDEKERKVVIEVSMRKLENDHIVVSLNTHVKMPPQRIGGTVAKVGVKGGEQVLLFEELAPENPDQQTLDFPEVRRRHPESE